MRRRATIALCALALGCWLASCVVAQADVFGPISLVSTSPFQQFEYAHDAALSGNGRYIAFDGSIGGVTGVWRRERLPDGELGELEEVAGGDAELPSISQNGQFISFTTNEGGQLAAITDGQPDPPHETHEAPNVYVRDMEIPASQPCEPSQRCAFTLASPLRYEYPPGSNKEAEEEEYGAEAAGRSALSANGQKVAFVTTAASNLDGPGTPPLQVAVHDLETGATELVSVEDDPATGLPVIEGGRPKPVPVAMEGTTLSGAVYTSGGPREFRDPQPYSLPSGVGASISGDGSTVAWMGQSLGKQVLGLPGEVFAAHYAEPLWRRIGEGEGAPTRRITGGSDPYDPQCAADPERTLPPQASLSDPCQGPFPTEGGSGSQGLWEGEPVDGNDIPQLSYDGYTVAFIVDAPPLALGEDFGLTLQDHESDLYVADMHEGLSRVQALQTLTEVASGEQLKVSTNAPILDFAISPDGQQVAFTTKRTVFPLSSPAYVSVPAAVPGLSELYDADLADDTLTRVTRGYEGGLSEHPHVEEQREDPYTQPDDGALSPSFSENGDLLAFTSTATNLVYGDGNTPTIGAGGTRDGNNAFVVERKVFVATSTPEFISPAPPPPSPASSWSLGVSGVSLADGAVQLYVEVPGAGTLRGEASSRVIVSSSQPARGSRRTARDSRARTTLATRTVASAYQSDGTSGGGLSTLTLTLAPSFRALAAQHGGLFANATVSFSAAGHPTLRQSIAVLFLRTLSAHSSRPAGSAARGKSRERGPR